MQCHIKSVIAQMIVFDIPTDGINKLFRNSIHQQNLSLLHNSLLE